MRLNDTPIRNARDLRDCYETLMFLETHPCPDTCKDLVAETKGILRKRIREYHRAPALALDTEPERKYIDDDGFGAIELVILPLGFGTRKDVEDYFYREMYMERPNSPYDCTGRSFTAWHRVFRTPTNWRIYHRIDMDV